MRSRRSSPIVSPNTKRRKVITASAGSGDPYRLFGNPSDASTSTTAEPGGGSHDQLELSTSVARSTDSTAEGSRLERITEAVVAQDFASQAEMPRHTPETQPTPSVPPPSSADLPYDEDPPEDPLRNGLTEERYYRSIGQPVPNPEPGTAEHRQRALMRNILADFRASHPEVDDVDGLDDVEEEESSSEDSEESSEESLSSVEPALHSSRPHAEAEEDNSEYTDESSGEDEMDVDSDDESGSFPQPRGVRSTVDESEPEWLSTPVVFPQKRYAGILNTMVCREMIAFLWQSLKLGFPLSFRL